MMGWSHLGEIQKYRGEFSDGLSGAAAETSSGNSPRTPCKIPKTKNQYSFHGESLKSRLNNVDLHQHSFFREASTSSASQEILRILRKPNVHYHVHKSPLTVPILSQIDPFRPPTSQFSKIHFLYNVNLIKW
jgi:hypothetical protein